MITNSGYTHRSEITGLNSSEVVTGEQEAKLRPVSQILSPKVMIGSNEISHHGHRTQTPNELYTDKQIKDRTDNSEIPDSQDSENNKS